MLYVIFYYTTLVYHTVAVQIRGALGRGRRRRARGAGPRRELQRQGAPPANNDTSTLVVSN